MVRPDIFSVNETIFSDCEVVSEYFYLCCPLADNELWACKNNMPINLPPEKVFSSSNFT